MRRVLVGDHPKALGYLAAPTLLGLLLDVVVRGRVVVSFPLRGTFIYLSSWLISAAFWVLPLWIASRLFGMVGRGRSAARIGLAVFFGAFVIPFATFCYGGQALYYRVFHAYIGRDTVRLGIALRGTVRAWFAAWGSPMLLGGVVAGGLILSVAAFALVRRAAPSLRGRAPLVPVILFLGAGICFWCDLVDSRFLQAATPDACFVHGAVHALRAQVTGTGTLHRGISLRTPAPLPKLVSARSVPPNVLVILTESVRGDAFCSLPPPACKARFLDEVAAERAPLGKLTTQSPGTFSASMLLWTGLDPSADFKSAHTAPVLWEVAGAVGYRTAYITSQNMGYQDFGAFIKRAGVDTWIGAGDLGDVKEEQIGAPDERATAAMLRFVREQPEGTPYFGVLHLSNTHFPYRVDPALQPSMPHSDDALGNVGAFHNHYRNSVLLQERTVSTFLRDLKALPRWDDTVVLFLSDHGEQFGERGGLYHMHSLFEEEVSVPGWLLAGARAIDDDQRRALATYSGARTYSQDIHATVIDLLGVWDARATLPLAAQVAGRSLLRARVAEPMALLATSTAVWEADTPRYGVMFGERLLVGSAATSWACYDLKVDPVEIHPGPVSGCASMINVAKSAFPEELVP